MKKIEELITINQIIVDKPATINLDVNSKDDYNFYVKGDFVDTMGASFDMINGLIQSTGFNLDMIKIILVNKGKMFFKFLERNNYKISTSFAHFSINEDGYIEMNCSGTGMDLIYIICLIAQEIVSYFDISYNEYLEYFSAYINDYDKTKFKNQSVIKTERTNQC